MKLLAISVLLVLLHVASAQDINCNYYQIMRAGATYYVTNPEYPNNYTGARQCRWIMDAPDGYVNVLTCPEILLPASTGCSLDRFLVSRSGDPQLSGADTYCGRGSMTATSTANLLSVALITAASTPGGRVYCEVRAQPAAPTPPSCSCGYKKSNRIVGGEETGINEFPMMAGLVDLRIYQIKCGGTIIDKRYVMTAAHCTLNFTISTLAVVVGEHDVTIGDSPATKVLDVNLITTHPQYNPSSASYDYDIALLRLSTDIVFSDRVGPACLPFKFANTDLTGATVTILGWGTLFPGGPVSKTLQKVDLTLVSQPACRSQLPAVTDRQICTYDKGRDACQDDSGGPMLYTDPATGLLFGMGIVSYGRFCASGYPGVNTRVTSLLSWIQTSTPGVQYCRK